MGDSHKAPSSKEFGWLVPVIILLILVFWAALNYKQSSPNPTAAEQSNASPEVSYTLTADSLYREYEENEVAADAKYKGQVIIISGIIQDIGKDIMDAAYVVLAAEGLFGVQCMYAKGEELSVAHLFKGQQITIKGVVSGKVIGNVLIRECKQVLEEEQRPNQGAIQSQQDEPNYISVNGQVVPNPKRHQNQSFVTESPQTTDVSGANEIKEYYKNGNLKSVCSVKDNKPEGQQKFYYENGNLKNEGFFKNGVANGLMKEYFENGKLKTELTSKNGKTEGEVRKYYDSGELLQISFFKNGESDGLQRIFYRNGQLRVEDTLKNGRIEGVRKTFYESGALRSTDFYSEGIQDGLWERYFENGEPFWKWNYLNGKWDAKNETAIFKNKKDGLTQFFFKDKSLAYEVTIKNGKMEGPLKEYYQNGNVNVEMNFSDGVPDGTYKEYNEDGSLSEEYGGVTLTLLRTYKVRLVKIAMSGVVGMAG